MAKGYVPLGTNLTTLTIGITIHAKNCFLTYIVFVFLYELREKTFTQGSGRKFKNIMGKVLNLEV